MEEAILDAMSKNIMDHKLVENGQHEFNKGKTWLNSLHARQQERQLMANWAIFARPKAV